MNEVDTCRAYIIPKLKSAGWEDDYITEQRRIVTYLHGLRAKVNALLALCFSGRLRSASEEELLDKKGWAYDWNSPRPI